MLYLLADDQSVLSSLTTISNDSNTPSVVGETLGSISLNDHAHKKGNDVKVEYGIVNFSERMYILFYMILITNYFIFSCSSQYCDQSKWLATLSQD